MSIKISCASSLLPGAGGHKAWLGLNRRLNKEAAKINYDNINTNKGTIGICLVQYCKGSLYMIDCQYLVQMKLILFIDKATIKCSRFYCCVSTNLSGQLSVFRVDAV